MQGKVVSNKVPQTVIVEVERLIVHPIYKKRLKKTKRFAAAAEGEFKLGELVEIVETKPISKTKRFKVTKVLTKEEKVKK
ncbi:MAG TPA: 30S ribosomal protein S17 [Candidatus Saccharimonadales bacterium]|nr:30S ribosomal protein S17 [Candidatus Saccharimonadales bacterium]